MKAPKPPAPKTYLSARLKKLARYGATLGLLLGLAYFAPASWLGLCLERLSENKLSLTQTSGTVWDGSGQLLLRAHARKSMLATEPTFEAQSLAEPGLLIGSAFTWHISLSALPAPAIKVSVENACCLTAPLKLTLSPNFTLSPDREVSTRATGAAQAPPSWGGLVVALSDSQSNWPAQWLSGLGAPWNTVAPKGALLVQTEQVKLTLHPLSGEAPDLQGVAQITLKDLSSQLSTLEPLGTYVIRLTGGGLSAGVGAGAGVGGGDANPGSVTLHLSLLTAEGRLELKGEGDWANQRLHFTGTAKAAEGFEAALANLLSVLGTRHDNTATLKIG